jgi:bifunctional DNA-binding transcriptional regulator/antitoxin component of YhaV-PrlF toxin-antitoxin module
MAGYSGTPLAKKLGIKEGSTVAIVNDPGSARALLEPLPPGVGVFDVVRVDELDGFGESGGSRVDVVWFFTRSRQQLEDNVDALGRAVFPAAACWVSWPKKAAARRLPTDLTEDGIREIVLPPGNLVDVKVCAVDEDWSGLKLMWRKERRLVPPGPAFP